MLQPLLKLMYNHVILGLVENWALNVLQWLLKLVCIRSNLGLVKTWEIDMLQWLLKLMYIHNILGLVKGRARDVRARIGEFSMTTEYQPEIETYGCMHPRT